jgi:hypothetical protein
MRQGSRSGLIRRTNGRAAAFRPSSFRAAGSGAPSSRSSRRPITVPTAPRILIATALALLAIFALGASSALAAPPTLTIDAPSQVETTKAHLSGEVTVPAEGPETYWGFEYTRKGKEEWSGFPYSGTVAPGESQPVTADLSGLVANRNYEARLVGENFSDPRAESAVVEFKTDPAPVEPIPSMAPATDVAYTTAKVSGAVDPEGGNQESGGAYVPIHWWLSVRDKTAEGEFEERASGDILSGEGAESSDPVAVGPTELSGLTPGHTYSYLIEVAWAGIERGPSEPSGEFTTLAVAKPSIEDFEVTAITASSAHFSGQINPNGTDAAFDTTYHFQCTPACPSAEAPASVPAGESAEAVSVTATHLQPDTPYEVSLIAENLGGTETATETFATLPAPVATISAPTDITTTSATLHGSLEAHGLPGTYSFQVSSSTSPYQEATPATAIPAGPDPVAVSAALGELPAAGSYTATLVITTAAGSARSEPLEFQTAAYPPPGPNPGPSVDQGFACADPSLPVADGCGYSSTSAKPHKHKKHRKHKHHAKHRKGSRR